MYLYDIICITMKGGAHGRKKRHSAQGFAPTQHTVRAANLLWHSAISAHDIARPHAFARTFSIAKRTTLDWGQVVCEPLRSTSNSASQEMPANTHLYSGQRERTVRKPMGFQGDG